MIRLQRGGFCDQTVNLRASYQDLHDFDWCGC
jgi:hypothetical protein